MTEVKFDPDGYAMWKHWVQERMATFWRRGRGQIPASEDPLFQGLKFTNVYRPLDRVSQDLLLKIAHGPSWQSPEDMIWRTLVYKHFNRMDVFAEIDAGVGGLSVKTPWKDISDIVADRRERGEVVYTNAFMVHPMDGHYDIPKPQAFMWLWHRYYIEEGMIQALLDAPDLESAFWIARYAPGSGPFNGMQNVIDINYALDLWDENEWVMPGPGAIRGLNVVSPGIRPAEYLPTLNALRRAADDVLGPDLRLWSPPSLMDVQNTMCELSKYQRGRTRIKFRPTLNEPLTSFVFPKSWDNYTLEVI